MYVTSNKNNFMKSEISQKTVSLLVKTEAPKGWNYLQKHCLLLFKDKQSLNFYTFSAANCKGGKDGKEKQNSQWHTNGLDALAAEIVKGRPDFIPESDCIVIQPCWKNNLVKTWTTEENEKRAWKWIFRVFIFLTHNWIFKRRTEAQNYKKNHLLPLFVIYSDYRNQ